ncbi:PREDICTED: uncharacterized protein LOC109167898 [Ipomoea nil]|uniref:uncharacterized protein LOC109167898 n=1 Tax=Ipomoea nil TaxID=35883 RepID=UPI0009016BCC|nr:PREDICTED: uncharacterized protein LOC109167898 [Ipomoea nil]
MWYWHGDPKGIYTVKGAYRDLMGTVIVLPSGFSSWNKIWNLKAPPKWKVFLWRAVRGVLPTTMNLYNRRVEAPLACPLCALCSENVLHSLVQCDYSKCVWNISSLMVQSTVGDDFGAWLELLLQNVDEEQFTSMVAIMYHIWLQQNSAVWELKVGRPRHVHARALASLDVWRAAAVGTGLQQQSDAPSATAGQSAALLWCSFDAAFSAATRSGAYGIVLQDADVGFIAAKNGPLPLCQGPFMAETYACKEALAWLRDRGIMEVVLRSDCSNLCHALVNSATEFRTYDGVAVSACRDLINLFLSCSVIYIPRTSNVLAHSLAEAASLHAYSSVWEDVPPAFVSALID